MPTEKTGKEEVVPVAFFLPSDGWRGPRTEAVVRPGGLPITVFGDNV